MVAAETVRWAVAREVLVSVDGEGGVEQGDEFEVYGFGQEVWCVLPLSLLRSFTFELKSDLTLNRQICKSWTQ